ncbi:MAG: flagellar hook-associated protein FlgL [Zoogloeaceae bacterium]|jgi:flagellar hook-associated protein 3 FlgL|nr:flagellar hook-associated protein FlgL [Zoogloeaceae bacterium]
MRISTPQIYANGTNGLLRIQYEQYRLQNQLSTGRKVVTPADDPVAAAQALLTEQKKNVNAQFIDNQSNAAAQLAELESLMASVGEALIQCKSRWIEAGDGAYGDTQLKSIAEDIRGKFAEILGAANNADANGLYRFAGYQGNTQPFVEQGGVVSYQGDSGARQLQVETSRFMDVNFSGRALFETVPTGNGIFVANAGAGNVGNGVIDNGSVVGSFNGHSYQLNFSSPTQYTVDDTYGGVTTTSGPFAYGGSDPISLGGAQVTLSGATAAGDTFTIEPSREESIFTTLNKFINTLESGNASSAEFQNAMYRIGASLDQARQHVSDQRAVVGARMLEIDNLKTLAEDLNVQYEAQYSSLVDLDYYSAISDLTQKGLQLQAAQESFAKITGLNLFNYI